MSPSQHLALAGYGALTTLLGPLLRLKLARRGRAEPGYLQHLGERFGRYAGPPPPPGALWLHAVSLGETRAAEPLIRALRAQHPGLRLLLTHGTATGRAAGAALLQPGDRQLWQPWDSPAAVRRFFAWARPAAGVLMETEVWPQLLAGARAAGVPVWLANARLSERSLRRSRPADALLRPAYAGLQAALAQSPQDAVRLQAAGVRAAPVLGNLKYAMVPDPALLARGRAWAAASRRPLILAASTREGEEAALLDAWCRAFPAAGPVAAPRLLLVPRHPQRFDAVAAQVQAAGLALSRRSAWPGGRPPPQADDAPVWLGDSLGEMPAYYAAAAVAGLALLGGSFAPLGGQNLIEAAACGCPLLMGPSTHNFSAAAERSLAAGASLRQPDWAAALASAAELLADPPRRAAMVAATRALADADRDVARRMATCLAAALSQGASAPVGVPSAPRT